MKKVSLCGLIIIIISISIFALEIHYKDTVIIKPPDDEQKEIAFGCTITNNTQNAINVSVERIDDRIPEEWFAYICIENCYSPKTKKVGFELKPGAIQEASFHFGFKPVEDSAVMRIVIYETDKPDQKNEQRLVGITGTTGIAQLSEQGLTTQSLRLLNTGRNLTVRIVADKTEDVDLAIFTLKGELVASLWNGILNKGAYRIDLGSELSTPGRYIVRFKSGNRLLTRQIVR